jgi:hypothetical protein
MILTFAVSAQGLLKDVNWLLLIKLIVEYAPLCDVESMRTVACAHQTCDPAALERMLRDYREELSLNHDLIASRCAIRRVDCAWSSYK